MEELIDLIATQQPASEISNRIKDILYNKAYEKVDSFRPEVAASLLSGDEEYSEDQE
jgi:hypothetical protein